MVHRLEAFGKRDRRVCALLQHTQRVGLQPSALAGALKRLFAEPLPVGRIAEDEVEGGNRAGAAEIGCVAAEQLADAGQAERFQVGADQAAAFDAVLDEKRIGRAARQRLDAERAGAGE